jgi:hypothetical protein
MMRALKIAVLILFVSATAENPVSGQLQAGRAALVIGNGNYSTGVLANPENDAKAMADVLRKLGFDVYEYENLSMGRMKKAIDDFGIKLKNKDVALFFYAGHGIQAKGLNYLIPVDAGLQSEAQVEYDCVQADRVLGIMEESGAKVKIIILDACRNNPFERSWSRAASGRGLASMNAPGGTLIGYATSPGSTASDGSGKNGLYTSALLESITLPGKSLSQVFQNVGKIVSRKSGGEQIPWISSSMTDEFFFTDENARIVAAAVKETPVENAESAKTDQVFMLNGDVLKVVITALSPTSIDFHYPGEENILHKEMKANIARILFASGRTEIISSQVSERKYPEIKSADDWLLVEVTEDRSKVAGLVAVQDLKVTSFWGGALWSEKGVSDCTRNLKKKAAELGAPIVLITDKKLGGTTTLTGTAYKQP